MHEYQPGMRINRPDCGKGKDMVGTFKHPTPNTARLVLEVLQKALVKPISLEMSGFVEPTAIARNAVSRVEAQTGKDMRRDFGAFLRRARIDRVHAAKVWREETE